MNREKCGAIFETFFAHFSEKNFDFFKLPQKSSFFTSVKQEKRRKF
jgi:hypothetical protein